MAEEEACSSDIFLHQRKLFGNFFHHCCQHNPDGYVLIFIFKKESTDTYLNIITSTSDAHTIAVATSELILMASTKLKLNAKQRIKDILEKKPNLAVCPNVHVLLAADQE